MTSSIWSNQCIQIHREDKFEKNGPPTVSSRLFFGLTGLLASEFFAKNALFSVELNVLTLLGYCSTNYIVPKNKLFTFSFVTLFCVACSVLPKGCCHCANVYGPCWLFRSLTRVPKQINRTVVNSMKRFTVRMVETVVIGFVEKISAVTTPG